MKRSRVERLKEIFDSAFDVVRNEWDFGDFSAQINAEEKEAEEIFAELMTDWQPIETAPKDGTSILVCDKGHYYPFVAEWNEQEKYWRSTSCIDQYFGIADATHWMPLPEPPSKDAPCPTIQNQSQDA